MSPLFGVYGASGCGRGIMPLLRWQLAAEGLKASRPVVFVDDQVAAKTVNEQPVVNWETFMRLPADARFVALAIADSRIRERLAARCKGEGIHFLTVKAANVVVMDSVEIGEGALLSPFVTITSNVRIGRHFHANLYSYVEHDCVIGDFVTFAPGVRCNGNVIIEDHAYIGSGAILKPGRPGVPLVIGKGAVVGMGAVVTKSVEPGTIVVGNPARVMEKK